MAKANPSTGATRAIDKLNPTAGDEEWHVIVETPKGSHNKYKFAPELGAFEMSGVLPEGMSFPYDFGFLPSTKADDGDPLDVLLLMDYPAFCGCVVKARLIGVIEAEQTEPDEKPTRNDRVVAVASNSRVDADCRTIRDLSKRRMDEIEQFFVSYNRVRGKKFKVLGVKGPAAAEKLVRKAMKKSAGHR